MELFSEIYSTYYNVVSTILKESLGNRSGLSSREISEIIQKNAFDESSFFILPKLSGDWGLMHKSGEKYISEVSEIFPLPLTNLQKSWLAAILNDPRIKLFLSDKTLDSLKNSLQDVEPLFNYEDFRYFDVFSDGDPYESEEYINNFSMLLTAINTNTSVTITYASPRGKNTVDQYTPYALEYSQKDDKFRVFTLDTYKRKITLNVGRIINTSFTNIPQNQILPEIAPSKKAVTIKILNERNALERAMLHFSNFEKRTEYYEETDEYICEIFYEVKDETELLIRILAFGPTLRVLSPEPFIELVRGRVARQTKLLFGED